MRKVPGNAWTKQVAKKTPAQSTDVQLAADDEVTGLKSWLMIWF